MRRFAHKQAHIELVASSSRRLCKDEASAFAPPFTLADEMQVLSGHSLSLKSSPHGCIVHVHIHTRPSFGVFPALFLLAVISAHDVLRHVHRS